MNLDNVAIVDVRTPVEFSERHYPGAINIPLDEVPQRINEFKDLKKLIVIYCRSGIRSGIAVEILKQNGVADVINGGGLDDMLHAKLNYNV